MKLSVFPREELCHLPTPIQKLHRLTRELGGPEIFVKRDDLTGLGFGGNKSRKLEFIIPDVKEKKADVIITWASLQSNWCLQTAAAARKCGLTPLLILFKTDDLAGKEPDGNLLLDCILNADIEYQEAEKGKVVKAEDVEAVLENMAREVSQSGRKPYVAPIGGSMPGGNMDRPLGAVAYANALLEICDQSTALGTAFDYIVHASGSGGTQAGLVAGAKAAGGGIKIVGIGISEGKEGFRREIMKCAGETLKTLGLADISVEDSDIILNQDYIGEGYGLLDLETAENLRFTAVREGFFLDPVYTGKAMIGLLDLIGKDYFPPDSKILFLHTGGTAALFPYRKKLIRFLENRER